MLRLCMLFCLLKTTFSYEVEQITGPLLGGEGPHWHALRQLLYFVDLEAATIHVYDPATSVHNYTVVDGGRVSFIIPIEGTVDEFLVSTGLHIRHVVWNGEQDAILESSILYTAIQDDDGSTFNDAAVDRTGNLWAGTMGPSSTSGGMNERNGKLYRVTRYTGISAHVEDISLSNGLAWSPDGSVMYYTDSGDNTIDSFDFDATADNPLSNRQRLFNFTEQGISGGSDGLTVDTDGNLWLACMGGYQVIQVNPNNASILMTISLNSSQVTSVAWGGADLDELYVTSGTSGLSDEELTNYPSSGATFRVTGIGARGFAGNNYVMFGTTSASSSTKLIQLSTFLYSVIIFVLTLC